MDRYREVNVFVYIDRYREVSVFVHGMYRYKEVSVTHKGFRLWIDIEKLMIFLCMDRCRDISVSGWIH